MTFDNLLLNLMKVLKYSIIAKLIIKKHKRDAEIIFSVIKNIKKNKKTIFFEGTLPLIIAFQKVNKQHCKILTFKYPIMSQHNYPKINKIPTQSLIQESPYITLGLADPSSITIILPSEVQNLLKPYSSLASFNFVIRKEVKFSVTDIFVPLNFFYS